MQRAFQKFQRHYRKRLGKVEPLFTPASEATGKTEFGVTSEKLRPGNHPRIFSHDRRTRDAVVLVHGLTDSPYYMEAIGRRFYAAGANVVLPLLPAHGLRHPDKEMEDEELHQKWQEEVEQAVAVAGLLGERVSLGGLSTGGALSINLAWRKPETISGGLFLFSAALDVGDEKEIAARSKFLVPRIVKGMDGVYRGEGANPYKYPKFTLYGGYHLIQIINENNHLAQDQQLFQPVFAAHSVHDEAAFLRGILELFEKNVKNGTAFVIAAAPPVPHASVVLAEDIDLDEHLRETDEPQPRANPKFEDMMAAALRFFEEYVQKPRAAGA